jgi:hypothetical protein
MKTKNTAIFVIMLSLLLFGPQTQAMPKITVTHDKNQQQFSRIKVKNETHRILGCYVAIDGYKKKFLLKALAESRWFKATDKRFNYTDFKVKCDYIEYMR